MSAEIDVEAWGLAKSFGSTAVLQGVDLAVARGTVLALLGPNGTGKTTMVRILSTLLRPDAGQARVAGHDVVRAPQRVRGLISLTGQHVACDEWQSGEENLVMVGRLLHLSRGQARCRAAELLVQFDLLEARTRPVKTYSGGMRRRLDLALSLVGRPRVIFLDEPTTGLDAASRQAVWAAIRDLVGAGTTVFLTTQDLEEADQLADRVGIINQGVIVAEGTPAALKAQVGRPHLDLTFLGDDPDLERAREAVAQFGDNRPAADGCHLSIALTDGAPEIAPIVRALDAASLTVASLDLVQPTLDDVFVEKTGRHLEGA